MVIPPSGKTPEVQPCPCLERLFLALLPVQADGIVEPGKYHGFYVQIADEPVIKVHLVGNNTQAFFDSPNGFARTSLDAKEPHVVSVDLRIVPGNYC